MNEGVYGMPGPGGQLGKCAVCGEPFVKELLLGESVEIFSVGFVEQRMCCHINPCRETLKEVFRTDKTPEEMVEALPEGGPLREILTKIVKLQREKEHGQEGEQQEGTERGTAQEEVSEQPEGPRSEAGRDEG